IDAMAILQVASNSISIHNPKLIDSDLVCTFLDCYYMEQMAKTFNDQFYYEIPLEDKLENMTLYKYNDRIKEQQKERKMKNTILLDFFELSLKEMDLKCHHCVNILKLDIQTNTSSLISQLSKLDKKKSNLKEFIDTDEDSPQNQVISNEDDILEVLQKDKQALPRVEQAYSTALKRFLDASVINI
ncbi:32511_t:CDS:2, partial [Gigaspora margarita]